MSKKHVAIGMVCALGITLVSVFHVKGAMPAETSKEKPQAIQNQDLPQPVEPLVNINQPVSVQDNRPLKKEAVKVKGIYMSGRIFNYPKYFHNLVNLVEETELNALVIDMKDDDGFLAADINIPLAKEIKARVQRGAKPLFLLGKMSISYGPLALIDT